MDNKLEDKLGKKTDRHFNIQGDATYIEHQEITVQSGANFYNGPAPKSKDGKLVKESELDEDMHKQGNCTRHNFSSKTSIDRIYDGIRAVYSSGLITYGYEYAGVYKAIDELKVFDKLSYAEFIGILKDTEVFSDSEIPTSSNISKIIIKGDFPNWKVNDKGYNVTKKVLDIGKCFFEAYNAD